EETKKTTVTVSVRLIRSFEYRSIKYVVFKDVLLDQTAEDFIKFVKTEIKKRPDVPPPFKTFAYGGYIYTSDPVINTENDEALILKLDSSLHDNGIEHETEISLFKKEDYKKYQANPILKW
ncbi:unnamed protein product, partial [Porites lobata]